MSFDAAWQDECVGNAAVALWPNLLKLLAKTNPSSGSLTRFLQWPEPRSRGDLWPWLIHKSFSLTFLVSLQWHWFICHSFEPGYAHVFTTVRGDNVKLRKLALIFSSSDLTWPDIDLKISGVMENDILYDIYSVFYVWLEINFEVKFKEWPWPDLMTWPQVIKNMFCIFFHFLVYTAICVIFIYLLNFIFLQLLEVYHLCRRNLPCNGLEKSTLWRHQGT